MEVLNLPRKSSPVIDCPVILLTGDVQPSLTKMSQAGILLLCLYQNIFFLSCVVFVTEVPMENIKYYPFTLLGMINSVLSV